MDLTIPKENENELLARAEELGIKELVFLKEFRNRDEIQRYKQKFPKQKVGLLINIKNPSDLKIIENLRRFVDLVVARPDGSEVANRAAVSKEGVDFVINISFPFGKDHTHYRSSGLNQVLAKLAYDNKIKYVLEFSTILHLDNRVTLLGRWMQNIRIFSKYKVPVEIFSFASEPEDLRNLKDLQALLKVLH